MRIAIREARPGESILFVTPRSCRDQPASPLPSPLVSLILSRCDQGASRPATSPEQGCQAQTTNIDQAGPSSSRAVEQRRESESSSSVHLIAQPLTRLDRVTDHTQRRAVTRRRRRRASRARRKSCARRRRPPPRAGQAPTARSRRPRRRRARPPTRTRRKPSAASRKFSASE